MRRMKDPLRDERRRLEGAFRRALTVALGLAPAIAVACSASTHKDETGAGGSGDEAAATTGDGVTTSTTSTAAASTGSGNFDAGMDASHSCDPEMYSPNPPDDCGAYIQFPCGVPQGLVPQANCFFTLADCSSICPVNIFNCHAALDTCVDGSIVPNGQGAIIVDCSVCANGVGRIPAGLARASASRAS